MEIKEPFSSAKPLFIFSFKGIGRLDPNHEGSYPLITDLENIDDIFDKISQKILARYPEKLQAVKIIIDDEMKRVCSFFGCNRKFIKTTFQITGYLSDYRFLEMKLLNLIFP